MSDPRQPLGEFDLIERFFARPAQRGARAGVIVGVGDDAAVLRVPADSELVAAVDTLVAGRHFPPDSPAHSVGYRTLAVNLSDMAAMGATPAWATLALTLPAADAAWLGGFADGLLQLADLHQVALVGGDTTSGPLCLSLQILGHVPRGAALRRGGAGEGDILVVTGTLGDAGAGLALVTHRLAARDPAAAALIARFEYPTPRVAFGLAARGLATAAMDVSDGLVGDLPKLAAASGLAAHVVVEQLPVSAALRACATPDQARDWALAAGDDYELMLAVPPSRLPELTAAASGLDLDLTPIGELRRGNGVHFTLAGRPFVPPLVGYEHFR